MSNDKGMQVLMQAAEILRLHAQKTRYQSRMSGMVAGERIAMQADVWDEAASVIESLEVD